MTIEQNFSETRLRSLLNMSLKLGFKPAFFGQEDSLERFILWRHDIDIDIDDCIRLAEIEAEEGVFSTYFLMYTSKFYNLFSEDGARLVEKLQHLGHKIGLHCDLQMDRDAEPTCAVIEEKVTNDFFVLECFFGKDVFDKVVSFHNPPNSLMRQDFVSFYSTYSRKFFEDIKYLSDSNRVWREGSPEKWLVKEIDKFSILLHPVIWAYEGSSMASAMEFFLEGRKIKLKNQLREDDVTVD